MAAPATIEATKQSRNGAVNGPADSITDYCYRMGGSRPIRSVLVANNGIAAVKFIRSIRSWSFESFGTERAITVVAMATPDDMRASLEHIRMADQFVEVPGGTNNNNYANVQLIVEVAERTGVDAVWPGWGHASENPDLPAQLSLHGIEFLGPPSTAMAALGDKIGSSIIAQAARLPTLPWSGSHVLIPFASCREPIPDATYRQACVQTVEEAIGRCLIVGYPAMLKASWGGGGKGIRRVHSEDEVRALFPQVQGEVPGSPIFVMKVASQSRHLEVQLVADKYGNVAALHSRDCSVQRRHQKIIEEGPVTIASPATVRELEEGACRLAQSVGYVGAATVEYLYSMESGHYYFLELNPRLQVEHPVTEWIAAVNLPAIQLSIAMGIPLWKMPELRRLYGQKHGGGWSSWSAAAMAASPFPFQSPSLVKPKGHVIAVRITSEDPEDGFKPTSGLVQELSFRSKPDVWAYFSIKSGGWIHEYSDSQFGHLFAFGESRDAAIANMVLTLRELHIRGEIRTNVDYTADLLQSGEYIEQRFHTGWLDSRIAMRVRVERPAWHIAVVSGALHLANNMIASRVAEYLGFLEKGQIPPTNISLVNFEVSLNLEGTKYTVGVSRKSPGSYLLSINQSQITAQVHTLRDGGLLIQLDGTSYAVYAEEEAAGTRLLIGGRTCLLQNDHDPSRLVAETPCKLVRYLVPPGACVSCDSPYAEVEVMKMCMPLLAPAAGRVHFHMAEGQAMQAGDLIATLLLDDPSAIRESHPFLGHLPTLGEPIPVGTKVHQRFSRALEDAHMLLAGFQHDIGKVVAALVACLRDPELPFLQWQERVSVLSTRISKELKWQLDAIMAQNSFQAYETSASDFPSTPILSAIKAFLESLPAAQRRPQAALVEPLVQVAELYVNGLGASVQSVVGSLLDRFLSVEERFAEPNEADVIEGMRTEFRKDLSRVVDVVLSHQAVKSKSRFVSQLLDAFVAQDPAPYEDYIARLASLAPSTDSELASKASLLAEKTKCRKLQEMVNQHLADESSDLQTLIDWPLELDDALLDLLSTSHTSLVSKVIQVYIRRLYTSCLLDGSLTVTAHRNATLLASWTFRGESGTTQAAAMVICDSLAQVQESLTCVLETAAHLAPVVTVHLALLEDIAAQDCQLAQPIHDQLVQHAVQTVSLTLPKTGCRPQRTCLRWSDSCRIFVESLFPVPVEPPLLDLLQLERLREMAGLQYLVPRDRQWHLFSSVEPGTGIRRMFLRGIVRGTGSANSLATTLQSSLQSALQGAELAGLGPFGKPDHVHVFLVVVGKDWKLPETCPATSAWLTSAAKEADGGIGKERQRLGQLAWEALMWIQPPLGARQPWRMLVENPSGFATSARAVQDPAGKTPAPYGPLSPLDRRRLVAQRNKTVFCLDFPSVFESALLLSWQQHGSHGCPLTPPVPPLLSARRLRLHQGHVLPDGHHQMPADVAHVDVAGDDVGMVAWEFVMKTPEFPLGRRVVVIANDVTCRAGSFGPAEDAFFKGVADLASRQGVPLVYLAANSGARIGLAEEVRASFRVGWACQDSPDRGFDYLYLSEEDHERLQGSVVAHRVSQGPDPPRWVIDSIIGAEDGLGVENLSGSGAIAGAFARAYRETVTLTYVTGRTVGIGAYLARLGVRCIQRSDQPIILTGFSALNKLLGRQVYTSHMQLGGPKVMAGNGVVHNTVESDLQGVGTILAWLAYVPECRGGGLPLLPPWDPPGREVEYAPETACDPHCAIAGQLAEDGRWLGGLFDRGSFLEGLAGWASTVVVGRARLAGIPVGVIGVQTQTQMQVIPADPGQLDSAERSVPKAGQVWFPDSASKTAQAMADFDREGLPLFVLANWRGFSGGQRDLFEGVLQAGSMIVEHLRTYRQPVMVYIPRWGELRGGAWVVLDSQINPQMVEMYAEETARGSVLEPEGMVEIKFRKRELLECMHRLDPHLRHLDSLAREAARGSRQLEEVQKEVRGREEALLPLYTTVAVKFAELHDTPERMRAKGVIRGVVPWKESRAFFSDRLATVLAGEDLRREVERAVGHGCTRDEALDMLAGMWGPDVVPGGDRLAKRDALCVAWARGCARLSLLSDLVRWQADEATLKDILSRIQAGMLDLQNGRESMAAGRTVAEAAVEAGALAGGNDNHNSVEGMQNLVMQWLDQAEPKERDTFAKWLRNLS